MPQSATNLGIHIGDGMFREGDSALYRPKSIIEVKSILLLRGLVNSTAISIGAAMPTSPSYQITLGKRGDPQLAPGTLSTDPTFMDDGIAERESQN